MRRGRTTTRVAAVAALATCVMSLLAVGCSATRPTVWYCLGYNTPNAPQYKVTDTGERGWSRVYATLMRHMDLRVSAMAPTPEQLAGVDVLIILNPEENRWEGGPAPRLMGDDDVRVLADYITGGGALLFGSNQDYMHNIEKTRTNRLLERFGMRVGTAPVGLKLLQIPDDAPVVGGLRWRFFFGSGVEFVEANCCRPEVWVWNDPAAPTLEDVPGDRVPLMAACETTSSGRVIVMGDSGWTANGTIGEDDNWVILWRQLRWLARGRLPAAPPAIGSWTPPLTPG